MPSTPPWDLIAEQIPHIVWVTDPAGSIEYLNRRGHDLVGLTPEEMSDWRWLGVVHPEDTSHARETWERSVRDDTPYQVEYRVRTTGGDFRWMLARAVRLPGRDGQVSGWAGTWTDIDDLKRLQEQLVTERKRDEQFRSVVLENVVGGLNVGQLIGDLVHDLDDRFDAILNHLDGDIVTAALGDHVAAARPHLDGTSGAPRADLTAREQAVLRLMVSGLANRDIAARLSLSVNTIRGHVQRVLLKLGAHSKLEAIAIAGRHGLVDR